MQNGRQHDAYKGGRHAADKSREGGHEGRAHGLRLQLAFPAPWVVDILGKQPFDFVWLDGEHGPFGLGQLEHLCRAAEAVGVTPIARVPDIKASTILRFLDRGIQGVLGPHIASAADAEELVRSCYFGPLGDRSFGGNRGTDYNQGIDDKAVYYRTANDNMLVGALLEDASVVDNLDEILAVDGIDYFGIGPNDFAQSLGYPGEPDHSQVRKVMAELTARIRAAGKHVTDDIMSSVWVSGLLAEGAQRFLSDRKNGNG